MNLKKVQNFVYLYRKTKNDKTIMPQKTKILLVEDDTSLGYVIKDSLEERGFEVTHATDGNVGWQQFSKNFYDYK